MHSDLFDLSILEGKKNVGNVSLLETINTLYQFIIKFTFVNINN